MVLSTLPTLPTLSTFPFDVLHNLSSVKLEKDYSTLEIPVELYNYEKEVCIKAYLPGVDKESITIDFKNGTVFLRAKRERPKNLYLTEVEYGILTTQIKANLFYEIERENIKAEYKEGILQIHLPKKIPKNIESSSKIDISFS